MNLKIWLLRGINRDTSVFIIIPIIKIKRKEGGKNEH